MNYFQTHCQGQLRQGVPWGKAKDDKGQGTEVDSHKQRAKERTGGIKGKFFVKPLGYIIS